MNVQMNLRQLSVKYLFSISVFTFHQIKIIFKIILGSIAREKIMKNQLQIEEEQYLENLYDTASDNTTQWTYDLYVQNIQLICPQVINSNYVHTSKVIYKRY
jgi:hypothetical protein